MRRLDTFVIAAWAATAFGLLEGVVLCILRAYPEILAPYKVSAHALWAAPAIDLLFFLLAVPGLLILTRLARKRMGNSELLIAYGFFVFLGISLVITAPVIIHPISAVVLSLGLTVVFSRKLRGNEGRLTDYLRRRVLWIPIVILMTGAGVIVYEKAREAWLFRQLPPAESNAPNVLVIVLDTVRYDHVARAAENSLTPNLDRLRARGIWFENAWAPSSWSLPSHASIMTGLYPHQHGADWPRLRLNDEHSTLGEFFSARGYLAGAFSGNSSWVTPEYLGRGFLRFDVYTPEDIFRRTVLGRKVSGLLNRVGYRAAGRGKKAPTINAQFLKFLDDFPGHPFFAYVCYMDANQAMNDRKYNSHLWKQALVPEIIEGYEQGLNKLDAQIGDLLVKLDQRGTLENTLIIITSDHGESFGAENFDDHNPSGHGTSLYPEQLRVPMAVIFPGKIPAGQTVTRAISVREIPAIITQALELKDSPFIATSLSESVFHKEPSDTQGSPILATLNYDDSRIQTVIWDHWQYLNNLAEPAKREELYDLTADPVAKNNLSEAHPALPTLRDLLQQLLLAKATKPTQ